MQYHVSYRCVMNGTIKVEAASEQEAEDIVERMVPQKLAEGIVDYDTEVVSVSEKVDRKRFARSE